MKLARVAGSVVATIKVEVLEGRRMLLCDLLDEHGRERGDQLVAVDLVDAGPGQLVLILDEGSSARQLVGRTHGPLRSVIVGIVDEVDEPEGSWPPHA